MSRGTSVGRGAGATAAATATPGRSASNGSPVARPTGTITFLFTDIEGSTRLLQELGAEAYEIGRAHV